MTSALAVARLDLAIVRSYVKTLGLFLLFMAALTFMNGPLTALPIFTFIGTIVASYPFSIGERDRTDLLLGCLPVTRVAIVLGRYLFALASFVALFAAGALVTLVIQGLKNGAGADADASVFGATAVACFAFYCLMIAVQFPLYFRYGYSKARLINVLPLAAIGAMAGIALASQDTGQLFDAVARAFTPAGALMMAVAAAALLVLSFAWTARAYARKDL